MPADFIQVRSIGVNFYVLRDPKGLFLIDGGFIGGQRHLASALKPHGWDHLPIAGILLTHGHLDHILNIASIAEANDAWIAAPRLDADFYEGKHQYRGISRITGMLESFGRTAFGFQPFVPDRLLDDGDTVDIWDGLDVIHLPGHTRGHSGFYCSTRKLLFCGDLFASFKRCSHLPPRIFNHDEEQLRESISKALALDLNGVLPNHSDKATPEIHLDRLRTLSESSS